MNQPDKKIEEPCILTNTESEERCPECGMELVLSEGFPYCYKCGLEFEPEIEELE